MKKIFPFLMALLLIASCGKDDDGGDDNNQPTYLQYAGAYQIQFVCDSYTMSGEPMGERTYSFTYIVNNDGVGENQLNMVNFDVSNGYNTLTISGNTFVNGQGLQGYFGDGTMVFTAGFYTPYTDCSGAYPVSAIKQ
jgi:hypothetical protein